MQKGVGATNLAILLSRIFEIWVTRGPPGAHLFFLFTVTVIEMPPNRLGAEEWMERKKYVFA